MPIFLNRKISAFRISLLPATLMSWSSLTRINWPLSLRSRATKCTPVVRCTAEVSSYLASKPSPITGRRINGDVIFTSSFILLPVLWSTLSIEMARTGVASRSRFVVVILCLLLHLQQSLPSFDVRNELMDSCKVLWGKGSSINTDVYHSNLANCRYIHIQFFLSPQMSDGSRPKWLECPGDGGDGVWHLGRIGLRTGYQYGWLGKVLHSHARPKCINTMVGIYLNQLQPFVVVVTILQWCNLRWNISLGLVHTWKKKIIHNCEQKPITYYCSLYSIIWLW